MTTECGAEYRPGHRDGRCSFPPGHPPIAHGGTYYQHGNEQTGWWWNERLPAHCGNPISHEPHITDLGKWCDARNRSEDSATTYDLDPGLIAAIDQRKTGLASDLDTCVKSYRFHRGKTDDTVAFAVLADNIHEVMTFDQVCETLALAIQRIDQLTATAS